MPAVRKRTGKEEEFSRAKIERSVRRAGASDAVSREVASRIRHFKDISTDEIRAQVYAELRNWDRAAAEHYGSGRRLTAVAAEELDGGIGLVHPETLRLLGLGSGAPLHVEHAGRTESVVAELSPAVNLREIQISIGSLRKLGAAEGTRLTITR